MNFQKVNSQTKAFAKLNDLWADHQAKQPRETPRAELVTITPEMATSLLSRNPENRNVRLGGVCAIAADIEAGRWSVNGETIIISDDGYVNDGQHRLHAIVLAGIPVQTMVVYGVTRDSRTTVDQGAARTVANYLSMEGEAKNVGLLAAAANKVIDIERNGRVLGGSAGPTKQENLERCRSDRLLAEAVNFIATNKQARKVASLSTMAAAFYLISKKNPSKAGEFFVSLITGENLAASDPVFVCREKLVSRDLRLNVNEQLRSIISAWNHWREGRKVRSLVHSMPKGQVLPEVRE
jgi:hypothetical protein